ncbi:SMR family transporter [Humibacter ginsenosidimutans]|nr:SMR family transporter [Humibacter ginsenosidimutans]
MSGLVLVAVLGSAVMHGAWNAIAKAIPQRLVSSALIGVVYLAAGVAGCLLFPLPAAGAWPYLLVSAGIQTVYLILLTAAYEKTEFSRAYPLTRGIAVLGVTVIAVTVLGERLTIMQLVGVGVVAAALLAVAWAGSGRSNLVGVLMAVAVGASITAYSVVDGVGVRASGDALSYASWLFLAQGLTIPLVCLALSKDRRAFLVAAPHNVVRGSAGGVLSVAAYTIVVWAQSVAPLALVSALRETGVLAAGLIGVLFFGERFNRWRTVATFCAVAGIIAIRAGA